MTTTSITASEFGRASYPINWDLDPNEFDYDSATEFYHSRIEYHFDSMCREQGSSGSIYLYTSEVYVELEDNGPDDINFLEVVREAASKAYDDLCTATEEGQFDIK